MLKKLIYTNVTWEGRTHKIAALLEDDKENAERRPNRQKIAFGAKRRFLEFEPVERSSEFKVGSIFIGRIERNAPSCNACFVALKNGVNGFLPEIERSATWLTRQARSGAPVRGEELLVQITREAHDSKLCSLTTELSLSGSGLVVLWGQRQVRVSAKIRKEDKAFFQKLGDAFLNACIDDFPTGVLFRTNAGEYSEEELFEEFKQLRHQLVTLIQKGRTRIAGTCLYTPDQGIPELLKRNLPVLDEIITDDPVFASRVTAAKLPEGCRLLEWKDARWPLAKASGLMEQLAACLEKRVPLPSGGWLMIEKTEAFTAVDVNSGPVPAGGNAENYYQKTNLEAAACLAAQLRLRNLSGLILADFITMKSEAEEEKLLTYLNWAFQSDSVAARAVDFTAMHICEISRKKVQRSLEEVLTAFPAEM